ncbi:hypothetical protein C8Q78DRAFT_1077579 [Trametes maxima]|nr:hypothetical protein C8Q78DRAFT_1077579 [Trametes maxima]
MSANSPPPSAEPAQAEMSTENAHPPPRVRTVTPRDLVHFSDTRELAAVMLDAINAHKRLYEDAKTLHGDINPNTIVIFNFDQPREGSVPPGDQSAHENRAVGALIDFDPPLQKKKA